MYRPRENALVLRHLAFYLRGTPREGGPAPFEKTEKMDETSHVSDQEALLFHAQGKPGKIEKLQPAFLTGSRPASLPGDAIR